MKFYVIDKATWHFRIFYPDKFYSGRTKSKDLASYFNTVEEVKVEIFKRGRYSALRFLETVIIIEENDLDNIGEIIMIRDVIE